MALPYALRLVARDLHYALVDLGLPNDPRTNSAARLAIEAVLVKLGPDESGEPIPVPTYAELVTLFDLTRGSGPERQLWSYGTQQLVRGRRNAEEDFRTRFLPVAVALGALPRLGESEAQEDPREASLRALSASIRRVAESLAIPCLSASPEPGT